MNPVVLSAIISLVEEAIKNEPQIYASLKAIFSKSSPTPADWLVLRQSILEQDYTYFVPQSKIPAGQ